MQAGPTYALRRSPARIRTFGSGMARVVRALTAVMLLGVALLVVALVGSSAAGARELLLVQRPADPTGVPRPRPAANLAAVPAFERAMRAADGMLLRLRSGGGEAAERQTSPSRAPGERRVTLSPPEWDRARRPEPPQVEQQPDANAGGSDLPPGSVQVAAVGPVVPVGAAATTLVAARQGGRRPSTQAPAPVVPTRPVVRTDRPVKDMTPQQREDEATALEERRFDLELGNVNLRWPQCDGLIWPHLGRAETAPAHGV
jgi:hypothetical protein